MFSFYLLNYCSNYFFLFFNAFQFLPLFIIIFLILYITNFLYLSLWNIFKVFFFTESLLLLSVPFLAQYGSLLHFDAPMHYFYCQLILAAAAAEAALFLGIFSHLYSQQYYNRINNTKKLDSAQTYHLNNLRIIG